MKLHLKGKGHEFSDAAKLLNYQQLWLDNLYPRAKFVDGLQLVEKAGHSKKMQTMRKEWIDEGKPEYARRERPTEREIDRVENSEAVDATKGTDTEPAGGNGEAATRPVTDQSIFDNGAESEDLFFPDTTKKVGEDDDDAAPEDDELDTLLAEQSTSYVSRPKPAEPESEGEDDLDALLAEQESRSNRLNTTVTHDAVLEEDDDLDALLAERDAEERGLKAQEGVAPDEDEDGSRVLDGADAVVGSSSPFPTIDDDENSSLIT
jgi:Replication Fork Protection Component Swi3